MASAQTPLRTAVIAAVVTGLACAALGAGAMYAAQRPSLTALEADAVRADARAAASERTLEELRLALDSRTATPPAPAADPVVPPGDDTSAAEGPSTAEVAKSREFVFITDTDADSSPSIIADYAQFLTGDAAIAAAREARDEAPPTDYYIVNTNAAQRTLPVRPGIKVKLLSRRDGSMDIDGYTASFSSWAGNWKSPTAGNTAIRSAPYWLTISDGTVTEIEEQYLP
jgi:hypothetical protein